MIRMSDGMTLVRTGITLFVAAILFGYLEPTVLAMQTSDSSALMNSTISSIATYVWRGLALVSISVIIIGAASLAGYANLVGGGS